MDTQKQLEVCKNDLSKSKLVAKDKAAALQDCKALKVQVKKLKKDAETATERAEACKAKLAARDREPPSWKV